MAGDEGLRIVGQRHERERGRCGSVFASATTLSFSIPGTSHSQRSSPAALRAYSGTVTVTPSRGVARLVQVGRGAVDAAERIVRGNACVVMPRPRGASAPRASACSRFGWRRTSSRYQRSKLRASCTSLGICWS
jgi:hypothetical protein